MPDRSTREIAEEIVKAVAAWSAEAHTLCFAGQWIPYVEARDLTDRIWAALDAERARRAEAEAHCRNHHLEACETCAAMVGEREQAEARLEAIATALDAERVGRERAERMYANSQDTVSEVTAAFEQAEAEAAKHCDCCVRTEQAEAEAATWKRNLEDAQADNAANADALVTAEAERNTVLAELQARVQELASVKAERDDAIEDAQIGGAHWAKIYSVLKAERDRLREALTTTRRPAGVVTERSARSWRAHDFHHGDDMTEYIVTVTRDEDGKSANVYEQRTEDDAVLKRVITAVNTRTRKRRQKEGA